MARLSALPVVCALAACVNDRPEPEPCAAGQVCVAPAADAPEGRPPVTEWRACPLPGPAPGSEGVMADVAAAAGLALRNDGEESPSSGIGVGACLLDHDGDGDLDVFLVGVHGTDSRLYRNDCGGFADATEEAGLAGAAPGVGCLAYDYDGDGDPDLLRTNFGPDAFYRNDGGRFTDVTQEVGLVPNNMPHTSASAGDIDGDGDLDLAVGGFPNLLYVYGDGAFREEARPRGLYDIETATGGDFEATLAVLLVDLDRDGDLDLFVGNDNADIHPDRLFVNDGAGRFRDQAAAIGLDDANDSGNSADTMGVDVGDCDGDGVYDLIVTNQPLFGTAFLFRCRAGDGLHCGESASQAGLASTGEHVQWGCALADLDHDGDLDLFLASGGLYDLDPIIDEANQVFWNRGDCTFEEAAVGSGDGLAARAGSRGASFGDLDNDGDLDAVVANLGHTPPGSGGQIAHLLRNDAADGHWLQVLLVGRGANRDAIGAEVTVETGASSLTEPRLAGGSYLGSSDPRMHFGLGAATRARVRVRWPDGSEQDAGEVEADRVVVLSQ